MDENDKMDNKDLWGILVKVPVASCSTTQNVLQKMLNNIALAFCVVDKI